MKAIDLTDLTPAPWQCVFNPQFPGVGAEVFGPKGKIADRANPKEMKRKTMTLDQCAALPLGYSGIKKADAAFMALARNDLDVQLRRGWHAEKCLEADQWVVPQLAKWITGELAKGCIEAMYQNAHSVGLLTKADAWYAANVDEPKQRNGRQ